jgi:hypothetical protein
MPFSRIWYSSSEACRVHIWKHRQQAGQHKCRCSAGQPLLNSKCRIGLASAGSFAQAVNMPLSTFEMLCCMHLDCKWM